MGDGKQSGARLGQVWCMISQGQNMPTLGEQREGCCAQGHAAWLGAEVLLELGKD
jgi:hypothetical protein